MPKEEQPTEEQVEKMVDDMRDEEVLQAVIDYYTQGNLSTVGDARVFILNLMLEEVGLKDTE